MKISYNWLKQYVDFNLSPNDLGEVLTGVGLEVEDIIPFETVQGGLEGVVIGEVKECGKHPDADKLSVTKVDVGTGELLQIVCGAPNVTAGQKVAVALVGSTLYPLKSDKLQIKKAKIRGVESFGMICAEDELGLGDSHNGILVLEPSTPVGLKAAEYFKVEKDFTIEIGLTPNRADAYSHIGVARDIATALNVAYKAKVNFVKPDLSDFGVEVKDAKFTSVLAGLQQIDDIEAAAKISVEVLDDQACKRYSGISVSGVEVKESPDWLKNKLKAVGLRPINNIVDITNFVLNEYGQPLHAFDADKIHGGKIIVKKLLAGTVFKTLDEKEIKLSADDLMICDTEGGLCLAGVMGGLNSGVTEDTKNIFLESAYFSPSGIRKSATLHNLRTDASQHFEKDCDINITVDALKRAALLICELSGGKISSAITDWYPTPYEGKRVAVSYDRMLRLAGYAIPKEVIKEILQRLEIKIEKEDGDSLSLLVPAFKPDVTREADIVEEIIRIYGYNSFAIPTAIKSSIAYSPAIDVQKIENQVVGMLSGAGFNEIWTNSVTQSKFEEDELLKQQQVKLLNSQTAELDSLRTSMLYSGLEVMAYNNNRKATDLRLYEFGKTYVGVDGKYAENRHLSIFLSGKSASDNWLEKSNPFSFYSLKSFAMNVLHKLGHKNFEISTAEHAPFAFSLLLKNEGVEIAKLGSISKQTLNKFDIKNEVFYADLNWDYLLEKSPFNKIAFAELPKFPSVKRDLAMVLNEDVQFDAIEKIAVAESKKLLQEVSLFDVYKGDKIEKGKKSYTVSFVFQHPDKTLTDQEIEKLMNRLMGKYENELGAVIRRG